MLKRIIISLLLVGLVTSLCLIFITGENSVDKKELKKELIYGIPDNMGKLVSIVEGFYGEEISREEAVARMESLEKEAEKLYRKALEYEGRFIIKFTAVWEFVIKLWETGIRTGKEDYMIAGGCLMEELRNMAAGTELEME